LKICIITPLYDPWNVGGAEKYIKTLVEEFTKHHEIVVITTKGPVPRKQKQSNCNPKIIEVSPINVASLYSMISNTLRVGIIKKSLWHFLAIWNMSSFIQIKKILEREKPNLIHTNGIKGLSSSVFSVIKHSRIPHVHILHDYELISLGVALYRKGKPISQFNFFEQIYIHFMRKISSNIDTIISPSKFVMDFHTNQGFFGNSKKYVIPHGSEECLQPKKEFKKEFLFIGQLTEIKGVHIAINAIKKLDSKKIKFHIIGKGPYTNNLKEIANNDPRIVFHGYVENAHQLNEIFDRCSYGIVPSLWYETYGIVINEMMRRGMPVIASKIGAFPEIVVDGYNGFLLEPGNINKLSSIIEQVLINEDQFFELSKNATASAKQNSSSKQFDRINKTFNELV